MGEAHATATALPGTIRKLWPHESHAFRAHLLRLDKESRRLRFAHGVSDVFIEEYASRMADAGAIVFGYFEEGVLRAVAELRKLGTTWAGEAEAAFSVEGPNQRRGIGTSLMGRVILAARNRGVGHIYMSCLAENAKMQAIAAHYGADLRLEYGEVIGDIVPTSPNYFSFFEEALEDRVGFMMAVLDLQARLVKAA
ncbi:MAG: GNAT family N-acetyltransferase [Hyphomicrobiaceae bacterium]